jgi:hypothetical protein
MKDGDTTTITYTPTAVSMEYYDVTISLIPQVAAPAVSKVTDLIQIANIRIDLPEINAPTTPPPNRPGQEPIRRVSLGQNQPGSYVGQGRITPAALPQGAILSLAIHKPIAEIQYGDIFINQGQVGVAQGFFPIRVEGHNPTLPTADFAAGNRDGLAIKATLALASGWNVSRTSKPFSVATIPIGTRVTNLIKAAPQYIINAQDYFFGAVTSVDVLYDGSIATGNANYVGEWIQGKDANGHIKSEMPAGTTNAYLQPTTTFTDFNGMQWGDYSADDRGRLAAKTWLSRKAAGTRENGTTTQYQLFNYLNTAVSPLQQAPELDGPNIKNLAFNERVIVRESYYVVTYINWYVRFSVLPTFEELRYQFSSSRATPPVDASWAHYVLTSGTFAPGVVTGVSFTYLKNVEDVGPLAP